jgi:hypothetical protein
MSTCATGVWFGLRFYGIYKRYKGKHSEAFRLGLLTFLLRSLLCGVLSIWIDEALGTISDLLQAVRFTLETSTNVLPVLLIWPNLLKALR